MQSSDEGWTLLQMNVTYKNIYEGDLITGRTVYLFNILLYLIPITGFPGHPIIPWSGNPL